MRAAILSCLVLLPVSLASAITARPSTTTVTITKKSTTTVTVAEPSGWRPAGSTKNISNANRQNSKARREVSQLKNIEDIAVREADTEIKTTATSKNICTKTVTKTIHETHHVYAACQNRHNYVAGVAADGTSGTDGQCDCEAYTWTNSGPANNAYDCCNLCWGDPSCVGSLWSPAGSPGGPGCFWIDATRCGNYQGYNYIEYLNGTKYQDNKTVSNGPCGLAVYLDA